MWTLLDKGCVAPVFITCEELLIRHVDENPCTSQVGLDCHRLSRSGKQEKKMDKNKFKKEKPPTI